MIKQATVYFKNGLKDWVDPYENYYIEKNKIFIESFYTYDVEVNEIQESGDGEIIWENKK